jgi:Sulfatase
LGGARVETVEEESGPAVADAAADPGRRFGPWRREVGAFLELFALCGVAIAQPTLDIFQQNADFLLSRRTTVQEAVAFAVLFIVVPALVLWTVEVLIGLALPRVRQWVHAVFGAALVGIVVVELLKRVTGLGVLPLLVAGFVLGVVGGVLMLRLPIVRTFLRYLSVAPPIFGALFVFSSAVTPVIFASDPGAVHVNIPRPKRVVMIVMDEFPTGSLLDGKGQIDSALFPNLASLAQGSTWYRNETTVGPHTTMAVPAILTGKFPAGESVPTASEFPQNLFTLLGGSYSMNVHESATRLCPVDVCGNKDDATGANDGLDGLLNEGITQWKTFASPERTARQDALLHQSPYVENAINSSKAFIKSLQPSTKPRLDFLHVLLPHTPWHYLGPAQDYVTLAGQGVRAGTWKDPWNTMFGRERHLLQVQTSDWVVGQVIQKLKRIGAYDDTMIIVTADHGVAFYPGVPSRGASEFNYPEIMWTPLLVKLPGQTAGVVDDRAAKSTDILPTIADEIGVKLPWKSDGASLFGPPRPDGPRRLSDWALNAVRPKDGKDYIEFDGPSGFARLLKTSASRATGDPALRIYRVGTYGNLVGLSVTSLAHAAVAPRDATLEDPAKYNHVKLHAAMIPWAYATGTVNVPAQQWVAVVVNGKIAGVSQTLPGDSAGTSEYAAVLPPSLVREGKNDIELFVVTGSPYAPQLARTRLGR